MKGRKMITEEKKRILEKVLSYINSIDDNQEYDWDKISDNEVSKAIVQFLNSADIKTERGKDFTRDRWKQFKHNMRQNEDAWKSYLENRYEDEKFLYWNFDNELGDEFHYVSQ